MLATKVTHHPPDHAVEHGSHESRCDDEYDLSDNGGPYGVELDDGVVSAECEVSNEDSSEVGFHTASRSRALRDQCQ